MAQALPFLLVLLAGLAIAIQSATNGQLGKMAGSSLLASVVSFAVGLFALLAAFAILRPRTHAGWTGAPWPLWLGGLYGAVAVFAGAWATPKLGAGTVLVLMVAAQIATGVALDHFGVLGLQVRPLSALRAAGVLAVVAGALMVSRG